MMHRNLGGQDGILSFARRHRCTRPAVVSAARHAQYLTQKHNGMFALHLLDLGIPLSGVSERMPNDFFRTISRSLIRITSALSAAISASFSSLLIAPFTPLKLVGTGPYFLRHVLSSVSPISS